MKVHLITCKTKHALYERVESIGCVDTTTGAEQRLSEDEAIRQIEAKLARFIVRDNMGHETTVEVDEREGRKYLITRRDRYITDNLLAMPDCSARPVVTPPPFRPVQPARSHCVHHNQQ
jgi:hypothetical protein